MRVLHLITLVAVAVAGCLAQETETMQIQEMGSVDNKTFTFDALLISTYHDAHYGWMLTSFYNNVKGIVDPGKLNPPDFCQEARVESDEKP
ncbi:hypothetical protein CRUP_022999, partial [Coryphaenoides rupestris]